MRVSTWSTCRLQPPQSNRSSSSHSLFAMPSRMILHAIAIFTLGWRVCCKTASFRSIPSGRLETSFGPCVHVFSVPYHVICNLQPRSAACLRLSFLSCVWRGLTHLSSIQVLRDAVLWQAPPSKKSSGASQGKIYYCNQVRNV